MNIVQNAFKPDMFYNITKAKIATEHPFNTEAILLWSIIF
jgi:hypothetical protein